MQVRALKAPGRYADGNGLYLEVDATGARRWILRIMVLGRRRDIGLGGAALVSLAEAREKASAFRKVARDGGDPIADRRKAKLVVPTFAESAETVHAEHKASWENEKHVAQWITTIRTYVNPHIGSRPVDQIETPDILRVLSPIRDGRGKARSKLGSASMGHGTLDWVVSAMTTSESPLDELMGARKRNLGEIGRYVEISVPTADNGGIFPGLKSKNDVARRCRAIASVIDINHGHAFIEMVKYLVASKEQAKMKLKTYFDHAVKGLNAQFPNHEQQPRFVAAFSKVYAAGRLAVDLDLVPFERKGLARATSYAFRRALVALD